MELEKLQQAAEAGQVGAQTLLGLCYLDGINTQVDHPQALHWLGLAAENRSPRAEANLALMYQQGLGVEVDLAQAEQLFLRATEKQEFMAIVGLARLYQQQGKPEQAGTWYQTLIAAADTDSHSEELAEAQAFLASLDSDN